MMIALLPSLPGNRLERNITARVVAKLSLMNVRVSSFVARALGALSLASLSLLVLIPRTASAAEIDWKGYTWSVTNGGMAGVAAGSTANVSVDSNGYLHLQIRKNGDTWTAAEMFTTTRIGFGTYQWQIDGPIDTLDKNVVLGLFPYGPAAGIGADGTNEIDIEYSRWGQESGPNGDWTNYPASGTTVGELSYSFSLAGSTLSTSRFIWTSSSIEDFLLSGFEPVSSTKSLLKTWKYAPNNAKTNIPQQALPLGMNLWCYAIPSDGKNVEIVVRDFQFVPEGSSSGGAGSGGSSGSSASGGSSTSGGTGSGGSSGSSTSGGSLTSGTAGSVSGAGTSGSPQSAGGTSTAAAGALNATAGESQSGASSQSASKDSDSSGCSCDVVGSAPLPVGIQYALLALLAAPTARRLRRSGRSRA